MGQRPPVRGKTPHRAELSFPSLPGIELAVLAIRNIFKEQVMSKLSGLKVLVLVTDGFEESELTSPVEALEKAGATVDIAAPKAGKVQGFNHFEKGKKVRATKTINEVDASDYDALHLPGGGLNADALRAIPEALELVRAFDSTNKPIAAICHAPWVLISAGLVKGRALTSYSTIQDDIRNAGGEWSDEAVVEDANWITSRQPSDLPAFNRAVIEMIGRVKRPLAA